MPGVGLCKRHELSNGRIITTVYPAVKYRKLPYEMKNVTLEDLKEPQNHSLREENSRTKDFTEFINPFKRSRQIHQKRDELSHTFVKAMPAITKECIKSSEYEFENGLRKVRLVGSSVPISKPAPRLRKIGGGGMGTP